MAATYAKAPAGSTTTAAGLPVIVGEVLIVDGLPLLKSKPKACTTKEPVLGTITSPFDLLE